MADIDGRVDPAVGQPAVETKLHVAGAFELLKNDLVHPRTGLDECGTHDGEAAALLDVAGGTEEPLRWVERGRVDATGEDSTAGRGRQVMCPGEPRHRIQQDHHIGAHFNQPLGSLQCQLRDLCVLLSRTVEGRVDDFSLHRPLHVRDFLGPFVDQDDHQVALRVVGGD